MQKDTRHTDRNLIEALSLDLEAGKFMDEIPGGFFIYRADGQEEILYVNQALLRIFQCDTQEEFLALTGGTFHGMVHPEDLDYVEKSIREQIIASQYDLDYVEYRIVLKSGEIRWVEDYGHFLHSQSLGDIFYVFVADATDKRQLHIAEKNAWIHETEQKEQMLQAQIDTYDKELKVIHQEHLRRLEVIEGLSINYDSILYVNLDTDKILPYRLSGRTALLFENKYEPRSFEWFSTNYIRSWVYPQDRALVRTSLDPDYIRKNLPKNQTYYTNYRVMENDTPQYLQLRIAAVGEQEHLSRIVLGARTVEEEVRQEIEQKRFFKEALEHARLANISKNAFLSNMSHDMRTPLNALAGFTALAKNHIQDPEKLLGYLESIEKAGSQLLMLINEILEISRIESGLIHSEETKCSLPDLLCDVHRTSLSKAEAKHITLILDDTGLQNCHIYCDQDKLREILLHLLDNAVKFTPAGGRVRIIASEEREAASNHALYRFCVEDNGIGIDAGHLEQIFDPFERVGNTTQSGIQGTGLGLTLARQLTEIMGGTLEVESTLGKGSTFSLSFRFRIQDSSDFSTEELEQMLPALLKEQKILLVDDNTINLEIESDLLEDAGFTVEQATDGSIALETVRNSSPGEYALILMDIQMPVMNGYEATQCIRGLEDPFLSRIPIIALSANAFEEDRRMSRESGMNAHMPKPIDIPSLLEIMAEILLPRAH